MWVTRSDIYDDATTMVVGGVYHGKITDLSTPPNICSTLGPSEGPSNNGLWENSEGLDAGIHGSTAWCWDLQWVPRKAVMTMACVALCRFNCWPDGCLLGTLVFLNEGWDDASAATNDGPGLGQIRWLDSRLDGNSNSKAHWMAATYELDKKRHLNADWVDCVKSNAQPQLE